MKNQLILIWNMLTNLKIVLGLLFISSIANAQTAIEPENGWWFNPSESGYGVNIELQADTLLAGIFSYDQNGNPIWYNTFGLYNSITGTFSGTLLQFGQGPCLGCPYTPPQQTASLGTIQLTFSNSWQGTVSYNGVSFPIERFNLARTDKPQLLLGGWNISISTLTTDILFTADLLDFHAIEDDNGTTVIHGYRITNPRITASGYYYPNEDLFAVVVDSPDQYIAGSSNRLTYYEFSFDGLNAIRGLAWQVARGSTPTGEGTFMVGLRDVQVDSNPPSTLPTPVPPFPLQQVKSAQTDADARAVRFNAAVNALNDRH